jgi:hypothetical protein
MNPINFNQPLIINPKRGNLPEVQPRKHSLKKIFFGLLLLLAVAFLGFFGFQYYQSYTKNKGVLTSAQVLEAVDKLIVLPTDEQPVIKTVTTLDGLNYQPFFMNAAVGDQFLIFDKAKRAILYRPSVNKIIEASRINWFTEVEPREFPRFYN